METRKHHIGKLVIDLTINDDRQAGKLHGAFQEDFQNRLNKALDKAFSDISPNGTLLIVDQLELELGQINIDDLPELISKKIAGALRNKFTGKTIGSKTEKNIQIPESQIKTQMLLHFLHTGYFPWWAPKLTLNNLENQLIKEKAVFDGPAVVHFRKLLKSAAVKKRLLSQFSFEFIKRLLQSAHPKLTGEVLDLKKQFDDFFLKEQVALSALFGEKVTGNKSSLKLQTIYDEKYWFEILLTQLSAEREPDKILNAIFSEYITAIALENEISEELLTGQIPHNLRLKLLPKTKRQKPEVEPEKQIDIDYETKEQDEVIIDNAGLVIFWPFLQQLFTTLNLVDNAGFLNAEYHERAVFMLQFLATGIAEAEEHLLTLNKAMAGYPLHQPVTGSVHLSSIEKGELDNLLKSVIGHWDALKNTSAEALRETFIQRAGILRIDGKRFDLKVERRGVDILRDRLPWSISKIKLPWMSKTLNVEW